MTCEQCEMHRARVAELEAENEMLRNMIARIQESAERMAIGLSSFATVDLNEQHAATLAALSDYFEVIRRECA